jgi:DNA-binding LytR/AlgR family response regulator
VSKLQLALAAPAQAAINLEAKVEATLGQLRALVGAPHATAAPSLTVLQVSVGNTIRMVPLDEVLYFEAADKYVRVLTASHEYLIRTPIKDLLPQLDTATFWQVHRGTVVRADSIDSVTRDEAGKLSVALRGRAERLPVSRLYAHLFKAM